MLYEIFLKTPGIMFVRPDGKKVRSPSRFLVEEKEVGTIKTMLKASAIKDYEIKETNLEFKPKVSKKNKIGKVKPKLGIDLNLKING